MKKTIPFYFIITCFICCKKTETKETIDGTYNAKLVYEEYSLNNNSDEYVSFKDSCYGTFTLTTSPSFDPLINTSLLQFDQTIKFDIINGRKTKLNEFKDVTILTELHNGKLTISTSNDNTTIEKGGSELYESYYEGVIQSGELKLDLIANKTPNKQKYTISGSKIK